MNEVSLINAKFSFKDAYEELWRCRDFEIRNVWNRAVFLTAFHITCFMGYGGLVVAVFSGKWSAWNMIFANLGGLVLSFVGIVLSFLWIMMAKGSKAWYEHYESAIAAFQNQYKMAAFDEYTYEGKSDNVALVAGLKARQIAGYEVPLKSDWILSTKGGSYSVSRINVAIGQLSLVAWFVVGFFHILMSNEEVRKRVLEDVLCPILTCPLLIFGMMIIGLLCFWLYARLSLKSSAL